MRTARLCQRWMCGNIFATFRTRCQPQRKLKGPFPHATTCDTCESLKEVCESRRLKGMADMLFSTKQPLRQSKVLTVDQILWMHCMLDSADTDAVDKSIFAYLLTALYGRCRHSDLANIESIHEDWDCNGGFLEIRTRTHKTGKSAASKTVLLPIVIPAVGVHGKPWIGKAKEAFSAVGLTYSGTIGGPLYRPPSKQLESGVCVRGITSAEVTKFLRLCFEEERPSVDACRVSSHSLKATTLTWAGKACLGPADQAILGRHSSAFTETSAVYSRDNAIRAVSELQKVIHAIHAKHFLPDCERSRYFPATRPASEAGESGLVTKTEEDSWSLIGKSDVPTSQGRAVWLIHLTPTHPLTRARWIRMGLNALHPDASCTACHRKQQHTLSGTKCRS